MARAYNARLSALTLGVPLKWIDNLLSHCAIPGVSKSRQGVERRISDAGLVAIEIVRLLTTELGIPLGRAAEIARVTVASRSDSEMQVTTASGMTLRIPIGEIERRIRDRVLNAVEEVARVPRGRPRRMFAKED
jgi:hypothetical protein